MEKRQGLENVSMFCIALYVVAFVVGVCCIGTQVSMYNHSFVIMQFIVAVISLVCVEDINCSKYGKRIGEVRSQCCPERVNASSMIRRWPEKLRKSILERIVMGESEVIVLMPFQLS